MSKPIAPAGEAHLGQGYEPKLLTAADLAALPSELPSGTVRYELHHGVLLTMPPPGDIHGAVESNLSYHLKAQGELRGHGKARSGDVGIVLRATRTTSMAPTSFSSPTRGCRSAARRKATSRRYPN